MSEHKLQKGFYRHVAHNTIVELLNTASNKDAEPLWREVAVFRPLDPEAHVYKQGRLWDYRPTSEFEVRYQLITDTEEIARCRQTVEALYS